MVFRKQKGVREMMKNEKEAKPRHYESPQIIYEGRVSTRAGNLRSSEDSGAVDLFNDDGSE